MRKINRDSVTRVRSGSVPQMGQQGRKNQGTKQGPVIQPSFQSGPGSMEQSQSSQTKVIQFDYQGSQAQLLPPIKHNKYWTTSLTLSQIVCKEYSRNPSRGDTLSQFRVFLITYISSLQNLQDFIDRHHITYSEIIENIVGLGFPMPDVHSLLKSLHHFNS